MKIQKSVLKVVFIRRINLKSILLILLIVIFPACKSRFKGKSDEELRQMAQKICDNNIILDSHIDWPEWIIDSPEDISGRTTKGDFDLVRAKKGGLNAALSVAYINSVYGVDKGRIMIDSMLNLVRYYAKNYPDKFALALNPADVRKNFDKKLFSLIPCLENGSPISDNPGYLKFLKDQGIAYITLCHNKTNQISDSNFDQDRKWYGLSPLGSEVIKEMNRLGIMIDISHSTDSTVFQALRLSKAPVIATHSSCRYFTPGFERNLPDTLIKAIAKKNGVIMVNFGSFFLDSICMKNWIYLYDKWQDSTKIDLSSKEGIDFTHEYGKTHKLYSDSKQVVNHIDHIVKLVGIDYVGIGSDYDGIENAQPSDLLDVSSYPVIVFELLKRGYSEKDIKKILSGNFLRVWNDVLKIADSMN
ncbi:MAG: dipeptidase [Bacteroidia bacterium]|nr:dipeptidase [Bacteroidia bacterium]